MFGDYLVWDSVSEINVKKILKQIDKKLFLKKTIISIGGISGTRKSETAFKLAEYLVNNGKQCHVISSDDYYKVPWHLRNDVRKNDFSVVGPDELDWKRIWWTIETFKNPLYNNIHFFLMSKFSTAVMQVEIDKSNCDVLIFEGLYGCDPRIGSNLKIHIGDTNPESTFKFRDKRNKENEKSNDRIKVVEKECEAVERLKENADIII
jgi:uridine kinase